MTIKLVFACMECGHKFKSVKAAEKAYFGKGCPKCGGADIDCVSPGLENSVAKVQDSP